MRYSIDEINSSVTGWGNRGWLEIVDFILVVCKNGAIKTHIMYKCNLNSEQIQKYLQFLVECKMLEIIQESAKSKRYTYKTTELGRKYIEAYNHIAELFS